jgi:antitoxin CptB
MDSALDSVALNQLKWRCRRGLLENDLLIERFFHRHGAALTQRQATALHALMDLPDPDLLDLLLARTEPSGELDCAPVHEALAQLRVAPPRGGLEYAHTQKETP